MKLELIKTSRYLLAVDDSKINVNDWFYLDDANVIAKYIDADPVKEALKIIAYLPLNDAPILEGVPLLPPLDVEDEELLMPFPEEKFRDGREIHTWQIGWVEGYKEAKEKYKFTEEDIKRCFEVGQKHGSLYKGNNFYRFIQSLSQPKTPTHFEFEMELGFQNGLGYFSPSLNSLEQVGETTRICRIKTITNAQGQQVVCGKYI